MRFKTRCWPRVHFGPRLGVGRIRRNPCLELRFRNVGRELGVVADFGAVVLIMQ